MEHSSSIYEIGLEAALQRFNEETGRSESLDTKASLLLGFAGIILGIVFTLIPEELQGQLRTETERSFLILLSLSALMSFLAAIASLLTLHIRQYIGGPGSDILLHACDVLDTRELQKKLLHAYARAYQNNSEQNQQKLTHLLTGFRLLLIGTAFLFLAFLTLL